jgi:ATP-dependent Zn protease
MTTVVKWVGVVLGILVLAFVVQRAVDPPESDDATFSEFLDRASAGEVESVTLVPDREQIEVKPSPTASSDEDYEVTYPVADSGSLIADLRDEEIAIDVDASGGGSVASWVVYLLPLAMFIAFWVWLARRLRN